MDFPLKHAQFSTFFISLVEANELQYSAYLIYEQRKFRMFNENRSVSYTN